MGSKRFRLPYLECKCEDCYGYEKYLNEKSGGDQSCEQCRNDSFHQTSVLCMPYDINSIPSMSDLSNFKYSLKPFNPAQRSLSTGHIPTESEGNGILGKSRSNNVFPANFSKCSCPAPRPIVYVTFANGSKRHEEEVASLCGMCDEAGFAVKCDSYRALQENGELNIHQWRDENFRRAVCVLFCISPAYTDIVNSIGDNLASAEECDHEKGAIYIYNLARSELVESCSIDKRFLFVLFTNSGKELTVPQCFSPYANYKYPGESETLMKAMQNRYQKKQSEY